MDTIGRALNTPSAAPAPHSSRLSASSVRRSAPVLAPSAARIASSLSRRTVRARIRLATFEQAITKTSTDAASSTSSTVLARDVIWSRSRTASIRTSAFAEYASGCSFTMRRVDRAQLGARLLESRAGREPAEQLRHPMHAPGHHRRRQMMRAGHDVGDDLGFRRIRHRRFQHADDGRRARRPAGRSCRAPTDRSSAPSSRSGRSAPPRPRALGPSSRMSSRRPSTGCSPITSKYDPPTTPARTSRGSPRPTMVKPMVEKSPNALRVLTRARRSWISGTENVAFSTPIAGALWRM